MSPSDPHTHTCLSCRPRRRRKGAPGSSRRKRRHDARYAFSCPSSVPLRIHKHTNVFRVGAQGGERRFGRRHTRDRRVSGGGPVEEREREGERGRERVRERERETLPHTHTNICMHAQGEEPSPKVRPPCLSLSLRASIDLSSTTNHTHINECPVEAQGGHRGLGRRGRCSRRPRQPRIDGTAPVCVPFV